MVRYAFQLSIVLVLFIPLHSEVMSGPGQTNPQPDWIIYGVDQDGIKTTYLHDVEQYSTTLIPFTHLMGLSTQGELAFVNPSVVPEEVWLVDVQSSARLQIGLNGLAPGAAMVIWPTVPKGLTPATQNSI